MPSAEIWKWFVLRTEPFFKVFSTTLLYLGNTSLNLDNLIPSTAGMFLPQRATREGAPGRAEATPHRAIPSVPQAAPAGCLATTWGGPTMIRLQPRASDGVAEPWLRSLDPGRASERLPPAARLPCSRCQGCARQIWHIFWHIYYYFFFFFFPTSTTPCVDVEPVRRSQDPWQDCAVLFCHQRLPRRGCL